MPSGFNYQEELSKCSTMEDITGPNGLVQRMVKDAIEQILQDEIADYITDEKNKGNNLRRNGTSPKKVKTSYGSIDIDVPRVREGDFEPEVIKKRAVIEEGLEAQIISMYAKGMTVRDIVSHVQALYGILYGYGLSTVYKKYKPLLACTLIFIIRGVKDPKKSKKNWSNCATACGTIRIRLCRTTLIRIRRLSRDGSSVLLLAVFHYQQFSIWWCVASPKAQIYAIIYS